MIDYYEEPRIGKDRGSGHYEKGIVTGIKRNHENRALRDNEIRSKHERKHQLRHSKESFASGTE